ncbi:ATP-binding protein [Streptoalloteichus hindustanus]|uniref:Transcriptional regulator, contains XRE-family HTH domain n=1 Tax=Streptoalloteichus hindustanus TaxID=2017 RepID=A0A1M5M867_STRHI|nr:tetratricopeptide repeat protein [Streptoalloteichus hindustanus]SHG73452.1 Transcriptional regulator, contains XRE-family HTH domain [Streptoalloteichus hindustanus]
MTGQRGNQNQDSAAGFGDRLRRAREASGLSLRELAAIVHYTAGHISKVELGERAATVEFAEACDQALNVGGELVRCAQTSAAAREGALRPAQLPLVSAEFAGRHDELAALDEALDAGCPVIVIDGAAGCGKTSLALRWAHQVAPRFPDGQLYADLRGYAADGEPAEPGDVLEEMLIALGVQPSDIPASLEPRAAMVRSLLAPRRVLVLLDNARASRQILPLLPGAAGCVVVITSRTRQDSLMMWTGARRVPLGLMSPEDAQSLLRAVIGADRAAAEPDAVGRLATLCAYLPLALRIAAQRVATRPHHRLSDLVDDLARSGDLLGALAVDDDETTAIRPVLSWSYTALDPHAARLFRLVSLHPGQISLPALASLAGLAVPEAHRLVTTLTHAHLAEETGPDLYGMHDLLRGYAGELATTLDTHEQRGDAATRLVDWYLHTSNNARAVIAPPTLRPLPLKAPLPGVVPHEFSSREDALRWYRTEEDNIVAVTRLALHHDLHEAAWQFPVAWTTYLMMRGPHHVYDRLHQLGQRAARLAGDTNGEAWVTATYAYLLRGRGHLDRAEQQFRHAVDLRRQLADPRGQAWATTGLGLVAHDRHDLDLAGARLREALTLFEQTTDQHGRAMALSALGDVHRAAARIEEAHRCLTEALAIQTELRIGYGQGHTLAVLAEVHRERGELDQALRHLERSLALRRRLGDRFGTADALERVGDLVAEMGRPQDAHDAWSEAAELLDELGSARATSIRERLRGESFSRRSEDG